MKSDRLVARAMLALAIVIAVPASAEEIGPGQLIWGLVTHGLKRQYFPEWAAADEKKFQEEEAKARASGAAVPRKTADGCQLLHWDRQSHGKPYMGISRPGRYCLDQDYEFECTIFTHGCGGKMIEIRASNVDLDFRGHTLRMAGTRGYIGVWGLGENIRVHNGRIDGAGLGIELMNRGSSPGNAYPTRPARPDDAFTDTGFVVEQMKFRNVVTAIAVAGRGNRIRDNVIDAQLDVKATSGPAFALLGYGPSARIERNTFRLRDLPAGSTGYAMYLRSADGTVALDNQVRVDDDSTGTVGIGLNNSAAVVLQRNRIDTETISELDEGSSLKDIEKP